MFPTCDVFGSEAGNPPHVTAFFHVTSLAGAFVNALLGASNVDEIKVVDNAHAQVTLYTKTMGGNWKVMMRKLDKPTV